MPPESSTLPPRRGRPRDPAIDEAIFQADLELLAQGGYDRATIEAVAERAGLPRSAVYRRFRSRSALAKATIRAALARANPAAPETDDPRRDLATILHNLIRELTTTPLGAAIVGLVSYLRFDADLREAALALQKERSQVLVHALRRMRAAGCLRKDLDVPTAVDVLLGAIYFRLMFSERKLAPSFTKRLVGLVSTKR